MRALVVAVMFYHLTDYHVAGDTACISGLMAQCENGAWQTQKCPGGSRECFALPSVKTNGTVCIRLFPLVSLLISMFLGIVYRMHKRVKRPVSDRSHRGRWTHHLERQW